MDIINVIDKLEALVNTSRRLPTTRSRLVDEEKVMELVEQLRLSIPQDVRSAKEIIGSIAYERRDVEQVVRLIATGAMKTAPLISDKIALEDVIDNGFARMMAPTKDVFRILVSPSG